MMGYIPRNNNQTEEGKLGRTFNMHKGDTKCTLT